MEDRMNGMILAADERLRIRRCDPMNWSVEELRAPKPRPGKEPGHARWQTIGYHHSLRGAAKSIHGAVCADAETLADAMDRLADICYRLEAAITAQEHA